MTRDQWLLVRKLFVDDDDFDAADPAPRADEPDTEGES